ncbi:MAG: WG repeat-containing protein [Acidobacteriota bacterium]
MDRQSVKWLIYSLTLMLLLTVGRYMPQMRQRLSYTDEPVLMPVLLKGYEDDNGRVVIPARYLDIGPFSEGLAVAEVKIYGDEKYGYIDESGKWAIEPRFESADCFRNGVAKVQNSSNVIEYIDRNGRVVANSTDNKPKINQKDRQIDDYYKNLQVFERQGYWEEQTGKVVIDGRFEDAENFYDEEFAAVMLNGKWGYIDRSGKMIMQPQLDKPVSFSDGMAAVQDLKSKKWGYIDITGKLAVPYRFESEPPDFSRGLAAVPLPAKTGNRNMWGYIDHRGRVVIEPRYLDAGPFGDGLAPVAMDSPDPMWGYIDKTGKIVISPKFDDASIFQNKEAYVVYHGQTGFIDSKGNFTPKDY